jgi:hypothetical protein
MMQTMFQIDTIWDNADFEVITWFTRGHENVISAYDAEAACRVLFEAGLERCSPDTAVLSGKTDSTSESPWPRK